MYAYNSVIIIAIIMLLPICKAHYIRSALSQKKRARVGQSHYYIDPNHWLNMWFSFTNKNHANTTTKCIPN